jgi:hypothetical protein
MSDTFDEGGGHVDAVVKTAKHTCESDATGLEQQIYPTETNQGASSEEDLGNEDKTPQGKLEGTLANNSLQDGTVTSFIVSKELEKGTQCGLQCTKYELNTSCWIISQVSAPCTTCEAKYFRTT